MLITRTPKNLGGGSSDSFTTVQVPNGTSPTADSNTDTLNLDSPDGSVAITGDSTTDTISFEVDASGIDHQDLNGAGTNTHAQIDSHIASTSNPHSVTAVQVGAATTASNVGAGGVGTFKQKSTTTLQFKNINAGSSKVTVTDDTSNDEIDIDIVPANIAHSGLSGVGTNTHAQIDTHIASTSNPHSVTAAQVGAPPTSRAINTGRGLTGGGDLSADRTLTINNGLSATKTSNFTVSASDPNITYLVSTSGGSFTATLPAASSVASGFVVRLKDIGGACETNPLTIARTGSDAIGGLTQSKLYYTNFGAIEFTSNGSNAWHITATSAKTTKVTLTASGTWVAQANVSTVTTYGRGGAGGGGGGGGGGAGSTTAGAGGGGAGAPGASVYTLPIVVTLTPGASYTYTIGAGGTAGSMGAGAAAAAGGGSGSGGTGGGTGGNTSFDTLAVWRGGLGGGGGAAGTLAGGGGAGAAAQGFHTTTATNSGNGGAAGVNGQAGVSTTTPRFPLFIPGNPGSGGARGGVGATEGGGGGGCASPLSGDASPADGRTGGAGGATGSNGTSAAASNATVAGCGGHGGAGGGGGGSKAATGTSGGDGGAGMAGSDGQIVLVWSE